MDFDDGSSRGALLRDWVQEAEKFKPFLDFGLQIRGTGSIVSKEGPVGLLAVSGRLATRIARELEASSRPTSLLDLSLPSVGRLMKALPDFAQAIRIGWSPRAVELAIQGNVRVLPVTRGFRAASTSSGGELYCANTGQSGTVGVGVWCPGAGTPVAARGFLAAGHVCGSYVGTPVEAKASPTGSLHHVGDVIAGNVPFSAYGPDATIVNVTSSGSTISTVPNAGIAQVGAALSAPRAVTLFGAVSGVAPNGAVVGALQQISGAGLLWQDVWIMGPSGLAQLGDSGAAVLLSSGGTVLGTFVGGVAVVGVSTLSLLFVQDMAYVKRQFLQPHGWDLT